jgi:hypothetical protein
LKYTDPSGEFIFSLFLGPVGVALDAACWGAVMGGAGYTASVAFSDGGFKNWSWKDFGRSAAIGAVSGVATAGIGELFGSIGSNGIIGEVGRATYHGFYNGMINAAFGGDFGQGFASGAFSSFAGSTFMMYGGNFRNSPMGTYAFSGLSGGAGSALMGGNFWEGAATGLINAGLNHTRQGLTNRLSLYFDGERLSVVDIEKKKELFNIKATSGKGDYMNDPKFQNLENKGPIPEGTYNYKNSDWRCQSKLRQIYNILRRNGDWGDYNVPLNVEKTNVKTRGHFYLHGGFFKGSAGCIDAGNEISKIYQYTRFQNKTKLYVKY